MRNAVALCLAVLCAVSTAGAQEAAPPLADAAQSADSIARQHDELRQLQATMENALNSRDLDALLANVDENVVFTTMNGDVARGRSGIRQYFATMLNGPGRRVESVRSDFIPDDLSIFFGDDTAVAFGKSNDEYVLAGGAQFNITARWTATLVRKDERWLVAAFHYSTNVFDNPILQTQRRYAIYACIAAVLLSASLAFFLGRRRAAKSA